MDKFWRNLDGDLAWCRGLNSTTIVRNSSILSRTSFMDYESGRSGINIECTREEFTAAALQVIDKLKAQGIDIGTDWLPKWEPKPGEVVCAWDTRDSEGFIVAKFVSKSDGIFPYTLSNNYAYQYIAPFTGEIPEPFKSRWAAEAEKGGEQ